MVRIRLKLASDILHLTELQSLIGKEVEINVTEVAVSEITPGTGDWGAALDAAQRLRDSGYDFNAWRGQRDFDLAHANDHLS